MRTRRSRAAGTSRGAATLLLLSALRRLRRSRGRTGRWAARSGGVAGDGRAHRRAGLGARRPGGRLCGTAGYDTAHGLRGLGRAVGGGLPRNSGSRRRRRGAGRRGSFGRGRGRRNASLRSGGRRRGRRRRRRRGLRRHRRIGGARNLRRGRDLRRRRGRGLHSRGRRGLGCGLRLDRRARRLCHGRTNRPRALQRGTEDGCGTAAGTNTGDCRRRVWRRARGLFRRGPRALACGKLQFRQGFRFLGCTAT